MKKIFALFVIAAVCCMSGCSNVKYIFENDERLCDQTETGYTELFTTLDARAAVYDGEYESFEIPEELNIGEIIAPIGSDSFVVTKDYSINEGFHRITLRDQEYGIYTLGGEYRTLFPRYPSNPLDPIDDSQRTRPSILYCNEEYILYYKAVLNSYGSIAATELVDLYLLKLDDMTEKRIYRFMQPYESKAVICDNIVYLERKGEKDFSGGVLKGMYSNSTIVKYDIEKGELEDLCLNAGAPTIYKDKPAFYVGDGNFVSYAEPLFDPGEYGLTAKSLKIFPSDEMAYSYYGSTDDNNYTIMGYIKDGKPFNILKANDSISVYDFSFADGCAVWDCNYFNGGSKMLPMFYSDEKKSVIVIEDKRADYESFIYNGKIYFFEINEYYHGYERAIVLDIEKIK